MILSYSSDYPKILVFSQLNPLVSHTSEPMGLIARNPSDRSRALRFRGPVTALPPAPAAPHPPAGGAGDTAER